MVRVSERTQVAGQAEGMGGSWGLVGVRTAETIEGQKGLLCPLPMDRQHLGKISLHGDRDRCCGDQPRFGVVTMLRSHWVSLRDSPSFREEYISQRMLQGNHVETQRYPLTSAAATTALSAIVLFIQVAGARYLPTWG